MVDREFSEHSTLPNKIQEPSEPSSRTIRATGPVRELPSSGLAARTRGQDESCKLPKVRIFATRSNDKSPVMFEYRIQERSECTERLLYEFVSEFQGCMIEDFYVWRKGELPQWSGCWDSAQSNKQFGFRDHSMEAHD